MPGFLYYLPGMSGCTRDKLAEFGLTDIFRDASISFVGSNGPDGTGGVIICAKPLKPVEGLTLPKMGYYKDRQEWQKIEAAGGVRPYWVGFDREGPPAPVDLQRPELVGGYPVRLDDGNDWLIPLARIFHTGGSLLPTRMRLGPGGEWISEPLERFSVFSAHAEELWGEWTRAVEQTANQSAADDKEPMTLQRKCEIAVEALNLNYRVGPQEVSMLGMMTDQNIEFILAAIIDVKTVLEMTRAESIKQVHGQKKTEEPTASNPLTTGDGEAEN